MWDWAANPPLPKRLTAAPVRIKPVPRSLLSIHSAIVDLQFVFLHLGICVRMCLHFFSDQINLIPLFSRFAPFQWTKLSMQQKWNGTDYVWTLAINGTKVYEDRQKMIGEMFYRLKYTL